MIDLVSNTFCDFTTHISWKVICHSQFRHDPYGIPQVTWQCYKQGCYKREKSAIKQVAACMLEHGAPDKLRGYTHTHTHHKLSDSVSEQHDSSEKSFVAQITCHFISLGER